MSFVSTRILKGHVLDKLRELPDKSIHCCVTSPPYYGLRSYGTEDQIWLPLDTPDPGSAWPKCNHVFGEEGRSNQRLRNGEGSNTAKQAVDITLHPSTDAFCVCGAWRGSLGLEPTPQLYIEHLVTIFREVRRVLRDDATFWVNIGDSYAGSGKGGSPNEGKQSTNKGSQTIGVLYGKTGDAARRAAVTNVTRQSKEIGLKPKDLIGIPWMLAFALRDDGWYLRSEITWAKAAPMPESVTDRPTSATEKIFLLSKSVRYFFDHDAVKEVSQEDSGWSKQRSAGINTWDYGRDGYEQARIGGMSGKETFDVTGKRNMRNWWLLNPQLLKAHHFAAFPQEIPKRAILAGTSERGVCSMCAAPWKRIVRSQTETHRTPWYFPTGRLGCDNVETKGRAGDVITETIGWSPTCKCAGGTIPATVLDPFIGSGTTGLVAGKLGRNCIGIDLNPDYTTMGKDRIGGEGLLYSANIEE